MASGSLPEDGEPRLGAVTLPAGRRITAGYGSGGPVAWATNEPVPDPGAVWAALSDLSPVTGLVPFVLATLDGPIAARIDDEMFRRFASKHWESWRDVEQTGRPWDEAEFGDPADVAELDGTSAAQLLADMWDGTVPSEEEDDDEWREMRAPFSRKFPGLAPAEQQPLGSEQFQQALAALWPARIGLAVASRPADVLPTIGWDGIANWSHTALPVAAVMRSWEDRFGATLLQVGFAEICLLAKRPPRTTEAVRLVAAEHFAFADECGGTGLRDIPAITDRLTKSPFWIFWWD
jgi:hypothetical protein